MHGKAEIRTGRDMNYKNMLDDTGMEIVNALRRLRAGMTGEDVPETVINYRDNHMNLLDSTGKMIAAELREMEGAGGIVPGPVTAEQAGLMSPEDKQKLDGFLPAERYATLDSLDAMHVLMVETEADLPLIADAGETAYLTGTHAFRVFTGTGWERVREDGYTEEEILQMIAEEKERAGV